MYTLNYKLAEYQSPGSSLLLLLKLFLGQAAIKKEININKTFVSGNEVRRSLNRLFVAASRAWNIIKLCSCLIVLGIQYTMITKTCFCMLYHCKLDKKFCEMFDVFLGLNYKNETSKLNVLTQKFSSMQFI